MRLAAVAGRLAALGLALGLALAPTVPASAADLAGSIDHAEPTDDGLQVLVSVPAGAEVDLDGVTVEVDGEPAESVATAAEDTGTVRRTAVLAFDVSNSMKGARFRAAQRAAVAYIAALPADVHLGIVSFAGEVTPVLEPSRDRDRATEVVEALTLSKKTRLYDGVLESIEQAGALGQRSLLVLSDGADTSAVPLETVTAAITSAQVLVDVVALEQDAPAAVSALEQLARAGNGRLIPAERRALREAFAAEADVLANQVLVTTRVPDDVRDTEATVEITLPTSAGPVVAQSFTRVRTAEVGTDLGAAEAGGLALPDWAVYAGPAALGLGACLFLLIAVPRRSAPRMSAADRVTRYAESQSRADAPGKGFDSDQALATAKETATNILRRNQSLEARISQRLEVAGSELKPAEWLLVHGAVAFVAGLLGIAVGGSNLFVGAVFLAVGLVGPWLYLGFRGARRRKQFSMGLPDTLQLMSGSLSAGLSLAQSVDTIVREGPEPIAGEFRRVLVETRLGVSIEDAFEGVAERFGSKDFEWVVMAIRIQRQVGGNLAELLDTVAATMREREYIRRQVAALAAEGKLSAWVLGLLPPLFMVYLLMTNYDYVSVMFTEPLGWLMMIGSGTVLAIGVFWMSRLVKVEV